MREVIAKAKTRIQTNLFASALLCICLAIVLAACSVQTPEQGTESSESQAGAALPAEPGNSAATIEPSVIVNDAVIEEIALGASASRPLPNRNSSFQAASEEIRVTGNNIRRGPVSANSSIAYHPIDADGLSYYGNRDVDSENYLQVNENNIQRVAENPISTFSIDVDTAAYSNLRRMLTREGRLPPHDAVRLEEMINYFNYDYAVPEYIDRPLAIHTELMRSPWNTDNQLLMVGIKGFEPEQEQRPNANLVFLVDVSGSMQSADKLGLVKRSLQLLVSQMTENDRIALVVYAGAAGVVLDSTSADEKSKIHQAIESLTAGGSTNGSAGIELAYRLAEENMIEDGINRVIIASDGDLNVGVTSIEALKELISKKRDNGIALTSLGFGTGNYNYSLMEQLADVGNGNAAYIDSLSEAQKVLVEEMQSTLLTIAKDVKIQVEFNPQLVAEYRLIGYENRLLNREDFRNDKIDAGEIGAGHTVTALYEISLQGSLGAMIPDRRYGTAGQTANGATTDFSEELAYVNIRYKLPDANSSTEFGVAVASSDVIEDAVQASQNIRFAAAVAGFGELLRGGQHTRDWDYDALLQLARESRGDDEHGYRSEMLKLVELAKLL